MRIVRSLRFCYFVLGVASGPVLCALLLTFTAWSWLPAIGHWLALPSEPSTADAIVVLSGGGPERMMQGIGLYRQGLAPQLWYTGDAPYPQMANFTDGQLARRFAIDQGVPAEAIRLLPTTSTWEDGQAIATAVKRNDSRRMLIVTSWYHSRRALCVIQRQLMGTGIVVYYSAPPSVTYGPENWWQQEESLVAVSNELLKFGLYWWKYGLVPFEC